MFSINRLMTYFSSVPQQPSFAFKSELFQTLEQEVKEYQRIPSESNLRIALDTVSAWKVLKQDWAIGQSWQDRRLGV